MPTDTGLPTEWLRVMNDEVTRKRRERADVRAEELRRAGGPAPASAPPAAPGAHRT